MGLKIIAFFGSAVIAAFAYCYYFDQKRRRDPDFRQKLAQKRASSVETPKKTDSRVQILNLQDEEKVQEFVYGQFMQGQQLMWMGKTDEGIQCMATAIAICGQQDQILQMVRPSLPPPIFTLLCQKLEEVRHKILSGSVNRVTSEPS